MYEPALTDLNPEGDAEAQGVGRLALDAQTALLPYALAVFAVGLPLLLWIGAMADNALWLFALLIQFAVNWGAFYGVTTWMRSRPDLVRDLALRTRIHICGGLLWAGAVGQIAAFALGAGPAREAILLLAIGAAVVCFVFTTPSLPNLLIVGPIAAAPPLIALYIDQETRRTASVAWGAVALAMALSLIMNRILRRQFAMSADRGRLIDARAEALSEAQDLARSKSNILATLSHEIRNSLTGITHVLAAALSPGARTAPSRDQLAAALAAANDLLVVLTATLDSQSAQSGTLSVDLRPLDACRLARGIVLLSRPEALAKGLDLTVDIEPGLEPARGAAVADPVRTRQILSNLVGNAIKYTVRGRVEVRLRLDGEGRLLIEVADTGPGLTADEIARAFEPFQRIERTGAGVPGAGLGLSLARDLAQLMGGELGADSAPGVGSRFWLALPFDSQLTVMPMTESESSLDAGGDRGLRVLIAEDDALNAAMLRAVLEKLGHQVAHAHDGVRALELIQACPFDVIMVDGRMPRLDGAGSIRAIRALDEPMGRLPVIGIVGGDAEDARLCLEAGADAVLRKPVSVAGVARAVVTATAARRAAALARAAV